MAGDWIPITVGLTRRREVLQVATETGRSRWEVVGLLVELWTWVTEESQDSVTPGMTRAALCSAIGGDDDFWCAVEHAGWLVFDDSGMTIPHFDRWFGTTSKSRLSCVLRKRAQRRRENTSRDNGHEEPGQKSQVSVTSPRPERREERGQGIEGREDDNNPIIDTIVPSPKHSKSGAPTTTCRNRDGGTPPKKLPEGHKLVDRIAREFSLGYLKASMAVEKNLLTEADVDAWVEYAGETSRRLAAMQIQRWKHPSQIPRDATEAEKTKAWAQAIADEIAPKK